MNVWTGEGTPRLRALLLLAVVSPASLAAVWSTEPLGPSASPQVIVLLDDSDDSRTVRAMFESEIMDPILSNYSCWQFDAGGEIGERAARSLRVERTPATLIRNAMGSEIWRHEGLPSEAAVLTALVIHGPRPGGALPAVAQSEADEVAPPIVEDSSGESADAGLDLVAASAVADANELRVTVEVAGSATATGFHLFLDTDDDASTGFANEIIAGADMMVEGLTVYRHAGGSPTEWLWDNVGTVNAEPRGSHLSISVSRDLLELAAGQTIRLSFHTSDAAWAPADWMPDSGMVRFELP